MDVIDLSHKFSIFQGEVFEHKMYLSSKLQLPLLHLSLVTHDVGVLQGHLCEFATWKM